MTDEPQDKPLPQTYKEDSYGQRINGPQVELVVTESGAYFRTDFIQERGMTLAGSSLITGRMGNGTAVLAARGEDRVDISDPVIASQVKEALAGFMHDKVMDPVEMGKANSMIDDLMDDQKLNMSAPEKPGRSL